MLEKIEFIIYTLLLLKTRELLLMISYNRNKHHSTIHCYAYAVQVTYILVLYELRLAMTIPHLGTL